MTCQLKIKTLYSLNRSYLSNEFLITPESKQIMLVNYCHFPTASVCTMVAHTLEFYHYTINELPPICHMTEKCL